MKVRVGLVLCVAVLAAPGAAQETRPTAEDVRLPSIELPASLDRVLRDYERAWSSGDAGALASLFTQDGYVSGPDGWIRGRDAIEQRYAHAGGDLRLRALAYATDGDAGWIVGAYGYALEFDERDAGRFVLALRRADDGAWLIAADLDSAIRPPGAN